MNYKIFIENFLGTEREELLKQKNNKEIDELTFKIYNIAYNLSEKFFQKNFNDVLKLYNKNEDKAYDLFNFKKIMSFYERFINTDFEILYPEEKIGRNKKNRIKRAMNSLFNRIWQTAKIKEESQNVNS